MATSSFEQKFYVDPENIDTFINAVTASLSKDTDTTFKSRAMSVKEMKKRMESAVLNNDRL